MNPLIFSICYPHIVNPKKRKKIKRRRRKEYQDWCVEGKQLVGRDRRSWKRYPSGGGCGGVEEARAQKEERKYAVRIEAGRCSATSRAPGAEINVPAPFVPRRCRRPHRVRLINPGTSPRCVHGIVRRLLHKGFFFLLSLSPLFNRATENGWECAGYIRFHKRCVVDEDAGLIHVWRYTSTKMSRQDREIIG